MLVLMLVRSRDLMWGLINDVEAQHSTRPFLLSKRRDVCYILGLIVDFLAHNDPRALRWAEDELAEVVRASNGEDTIQLSERQG